MKRSPFALGGLLLLLLVLPVASARRNNETGKRTQSGTPKSAPAAATPAATPTPTPTRRRVSEQLPAPRRPGAARNRRQPSASPHAQRTSAPAPAQSGAVTLDAAAPVFPTEYNGDVRDLPQVPSSRRIERELRPPPVMRPTTRVAPSLAESLPNIMLAPMPAPSRNFAGMSSDTPVWGGPAGDGPPPDVSGAAGLNHYIQAANFSWAIYSKTGTLLAAITENSLWEVAGLPPCTGNSRGDPIVIYDQFTDRWILTNMAYSVDASNVPLAPFYQCLAVSKTSDPLAGGWWFYALRMDTGAAGQPPVGILNDYAKFGNWNDGCLYMSADGYRNDDPDGVMFATLNKFDMQNGLPLTAALGYIKLDTNNRSFNLIPGNISGARLPASLPPAGTPNYFVSSSRTQPLDAFEVRRITPGFRCGGGGTLYAPVYVAHASYFPPDDGAFPLNSDEIIPQPFTATRLDSLSIRLMQKVQYRRVGAAESLWVTHTVRTADGAGSTGLLWGQINVSGGFINATPTQQQIYKPDSTIYRWLGSIAADRAGNAALGYSLSGSNFYPSIAYAGRLATDPPNNMSQTEILLAGGAGSQPESERWGDYSEMSVDPVDDCTFWYTNQYYSSQANGNAGNWQTRIGAFKFPGCAPACTYGVSPAGATVGASGGAGTVAVTPTAGCAWTATSDVPWLVITSPCSCSGSGTFTYAVAPNPTPLARGGTLTVAGQTFTVTQAANSVQLGAATFGVGEAARKVFINVTRAGATSAPAWVDYATADGTAGRQKDYTQTLGTLYFAPGEVTKTVTVFVTNDVFAEAAETFTLTLSNASGTAVGSPSTAVVTITSDDAATGANPVGDAAFSADFFVRQHYVDFFGREADTPGLAFWTNEITLCGASLPCRDVRRVNVSAAFFLSIEFQETGYLVYRFYKAAYGDAVSPNVAGTVPVVRLNEFLPDTQRIGQNVIVNFGNWQAQLEANKQAFALEFVLRPRFLAAYPLSMTPAQFVDKLRLNTGSALTQTERDLLVLELSLNNTGAGRASVLRRVVEDASLQVGEFNRAFVLMQYFGYLRRNPNDAPDVDFRGWKFWLDKLNQFGGDFQRAEMVKAFIASTEYRQRFGP